MRLTVGLAREKGIEVVERGDPATASAHEIVELIGTIEEQDHHSEAAEWFAAQPDPDTAIDEMTSAVMAPAHEPLVVLAGMTLIGALCSDRVDEAVRTHLEGPHDSLILNWLTQRGAIDPAAIEPPRLLRE